MSEVTVAAIRIARSPLPYSLTLSLPSCPILSFSAQMSFPFSTCSRSVFCSVLPACSLCYLLVLYLFPRSVLLACFLDVICPFSTCSPAPFFFPIFSLCVISTSLASMPSSLAPFSAPFSVRFLRCLPLHTVLVTFSIQLFRFQAHYLYSIPYLYSSLPHSRLCFPVFYHVLRFPVFYHVLFPFAVLYQVICPVL